MDQTPTQWGALPAEWEHFHRLGLLADLLPVVSNPQAVIAENSSLHSLGKTPSTYNGKGHAVGIPRWTSHHTELRELKRWQGNSDLGICLQTRNVRAIDVDIDDPDTADAVAWWVETVLGQELPARCRGDSRKFLLALHMPGEFVKRVIRTAHGAIEFLATGQQFIACGTHPKGARYEWRGGLPAEFPAVTPAQFEELWTILAKEFAIEPVATGRGMAKKLLLPRNSDDIKDPVVAFLEATGWVKGWQRDGRVDVRCPWEGSHTTESADSASTWFPAGVGGFEQGHYRCLHAHCEHRTDQEFLEEVGYIADAFEVVATGTAASAAGGELSAEDAAERPLPVFQRKRDGTIEASINNLVMALNRPDLSGMHVCFDRFLDAVMCSPWLGGGEQDQPHTIQWRTFTDRDYTELRGTLERRSFASIGRELIRDVVEKVAHDNAIDSAIEWLENRVPAWDGVDRITGFWTRYFRTVDTAYTRATGRYTWTALAGRCLQPGVKADMVPVLIGKQGSGKTTGVAALVPHSDLYTKLSFGMKEDDMSRKLRGVLVAELDELRGLNSKDSESIKSWVSATHEEWTPKFREFKTKYGRRALCIGTTNHSEFLADAEGEERRWLPLVVGTTDLAALEADREQLWAQARDEFKAGGVQWKDSQTLAREVHADHRVGDPWQPAVWEWLCSDGMEGKGEPIGLNPVRGIDLLVNALGLKLSAISQKEERRMSAILRTLGYERKVARFGKATHKAFTPSEATRKALYAYSGVEDLA